MNSKYRIYRGQIQDGRKFVTFREDAIPNQTLSTEPSRAVHDISETFNWGTHDAGLKQLALAMLLATFQDAHLASYRYDQFAREMLEPLGSGEWHLDSLQILRWANFSGFGT